MRRQRGRRRPAPPPPPPGLIWDLDEFVSHAEYARPHAEEMVAFDSLPAHVRSELRRTGQAALAYLEHQRAEEERKRQSAFHKLLGWF